MKKALAILLIVPLIALAGCSQTLQLLSGGINNPITPSRALALHAAFDGGVVVAAGRYAALPRCPAANPCSSQAVVNKLRTYVNGAEATLDKVDQWAAGNTSIDIQAIYQAAIIAVTEAQSFGRDNGLKFTDAFK